MSANAFDTLKAAKSLEAAGFDETQAEAVAATVGDAVRAHTEPLANSIAAIADTMATKEDVATVNARIETVKSDLGTVQDRVATISGTMATKDDVATVNHKVETVKDTVETVKSDLETVKAKVETISETMATKEYVQAAIALEMKALYRHLWVMGTGVVGVTVALVKLLP